MAIRVKEGDVFLIPVTPERVAVGQVAHRYERGKGPWFMVVYDGIYPRDSVPDLERVLAQPIRLQAITFDPLIRTGRWPRVGNDAPPTDRISWPIFKVMTSPPDTYAVIDHAGTVIRAASRRDVDELPMWTSVGPIRLEHAVQALAGLGPWTMDYELLLPPGSRERGHVGRGAPLTTLDELR